MIPAKWIWYRDLVLVLVSKDLATRYKGSVLGFCWSVLNPLASACVFYVVFGLFMRMHVPHFIVVLLSAMFPWQWFSNSVNEGAMIFLANPTLVKKVAFPRQAIPLVMNLQHMVHFLLSLPVLAAFMLAEGLWPGLNWLWDVPLLAVLTLSMTYGLSLILGSLNLFLRDIGNLVSVFVQVAFFGTPIMYVLSIVPEKYVWCFKVNPVAPLFICWRAALYGGGIPMEWFPYAVGYSAMFMALGMLVFRRLQRRFAEVM